MADLPDSTLDSFDRLSDGDKRRLLITLLDKVGGEVELDVTKPADPRRRIEVWRHENRPDVRTVRVAGGGEDRG